MLSASFVNCIVYLNMMMMHFLILLTIQFMRLYLCGMDVNDDVMTTIMMMILSMMIVTVILTSFNNDDGDGDIDNEL